MTRSVHLSDTGAGQKTRAVVGDIVQACRSYNLWMSLGYIDITHRYKRSYLGPFWITINIGMMIVGIGFIYGNVLDTIRSTYIEYLAVGIITWNLINAIILEGSLSYVVESSAIKNTVLSKHIYILRIVFRNMIILGHNMIILVPLYLISSHWPGIGILWVVPGFALLVLFLVPAALFLAVVGARYRDVPPAVAGVMQLTFFATPIIWEADALPAHRWIVDLNPFYHLIEVVRAPLLDGVLPLDSFAIVAGLAVIMSGLALAVYAQARQSIVYWL